MPAFSLKPPSSRVTNCSRVWNIPSMNGLDEDEMNGERRIRWKRSKNLILAPINSQEEWDDTETVHQSGLWSLQHVQLAMQGVHQLDLGNPCSLAPDDAFKQILLCLMRLLCYVGADNQTHYESWSNFKLIQLWFFRTCLMSSKSDVMKHKKNSIFYIEGDTTKQSMHDKDQWSSRSQQSKEPAKGCI